MEWQESVQIKVNKNSCKRLSKVEARSGMSSGGQTGREMYRGFIWRNLKESEHFTDLSIEARMILKWILKKEGERVWTGLTL